MPNALTNAPIETWAEARRFYDEFFWDSRHIDWPSDIGHFHRLKMVSRQYRRIRSRVQQFTTLAEILLWMNGSPHEVLYAPMNFVDHRRKPREPVGVKISQVFRDDDINTMFRFFEGSDEEIIGEGWSGTMVVVPPTGQRFDADAWRFGLASYGIYLQQGAWGSNEEKNVWEFQFSILERDFKITDSDNPTWAWQDPTDDDDEEISDWEDACNRAMAIEDGEDDEEVFGDGYAR